MELADLMRQTEGKTLEFKRDASSAGPILRTVCAFANTAGGTLLIGIEDRTGDVLGVADPLDTEERLASIIADGIAPTLVPDIELIPWRDTRVIAVRVYPGPSRPYRVTSGSAQPGAYVRIGSTNRIADDVLAAELARGARNEGFDEIPVPELEQDALDLDAAREALDSVRELRPRELKTLRLITEHQGREVATTGAVLMFGRNRLDQFPDAWIQVGRFKGCDKTTVIDSADLNEYPVRAIEHAIAFVTRNTSVAYEISGTRRLEVPEYPPVAVREAIVNAVVHADYSQRGAPIRIAIFDDRIEITSPGILVAGLTIADVLSGVSKLRNRVIGRVFREAGLIEQWGSGIQRMREACLTAGLGEPLIEEVATTFRVTLFATRTGARPLDALDEATLSTLRDTDGLSTREIAERINRTPRATRTRLQRLIEAGLVVEIGSAPNDPHRRYYVAEEPARYGRD
ncbi:MAG: helix-turn-helix domain-containing protein [Actinomycetota bacterium]|nr:MAG: transcriptional regulator with HTH [Actinomycetota bacterium]MDO8950012.1 helix-turn-helix domain-containing protein [Actinomycetota bacterium]MDP3630195.1 helix-turn-helix domain-containing protein [Actinomycetota bacterium]